MKTTAKKYRLVVYDVWGNASDGFEVNQAFYTNVYIHVSENTSDLAINRRLGFKGLSWEGDEYCLYATRKRNGMPACELRLVE
jgi:hypothetical protein